MSEDISTGLYLTTLNGGMAIPQDSGFIISITKTISSAFLKCQLSGSLSS